MDISRPQGLRVSGVLSLTHENAPRPEPLSLLVLIPVHLQVWELQSTTAPSNVKTRLCWPLPRAMWPFLITFFSPYPFLLHTNNTAVPYAGSHLPLCWSSGESHNVTVGAALHPPGGTQGTLGWVNLAAVPQNFCRAHSYRGGTLVPQEPPPLSGRCFHCEPKGFRECFCARMFGNFS